MPVQSCHQVLMVLPLGQSGSSLAVGLFQERPLNLPPGLPETEVIGRQVVGLRSGPVMQRGCLLLPLMEVGYGGCHRALDSVPRMGLGVQLLVDAGPCLF